MNIRELLKRHEGYELNPYKCTAGHWTVGVGHNLDSGKEPVPLVISDQQAEDYLTADIAESTESCKKYFPLFYELCPARQAVLISMAFNLGGAGLGKFVSMIQAIMLGDFKAAAFHMIDSKWASQVGKRATELAKMMETGVWI